MSFDHLRLESVVIASHAVTALARTMQLDSGVRAGPRRGGNILLLHVQETCRGQKYGVVLQFYACRSSNYTASLGL